MKYQFSLLNELKSSLMKFKRGLSRQTSTLSRAIHLSFVILFLAFIKPAGAQERCLYDILEEKNLQSDPEYKGRREDLEKRIQSYIKNNQNANAAAVSIPVVFQIVHNGDAIGTGENLSDAQIMAQLSQLNADYGRTNTDAGNTPAAFAGVAANTMIQFCLATTDPNGQPTTGIVRHNLDLDQDVCWNADFIEQNIILGRVWDRDKYLNIFTVLKIARDDCSSNSILGYAYPPLTNANRDAAVHAYYTIGSLASPNPANPTFGMGRTVTHEVGHWLDLDHIWGGGCGIDDGVADTPDQAADNNGCPTHPSPSCTNAGDMFMNYMDYVDDNCMNMFSAGQGMRMMAAIMTSRPTFLTSQCGMNPANDGYTCANAIEINAAGTFNAPGPNQGNGAIDGTHANWYKFTPPMTGMIRIYTCGLANGGNNHFHVYDDASVCPTNTNNVLYTADRGCAADTMDATLGVDLDNIPVTSGVPIFIEWDDLGGNTTAFTWALEYMGGGGGGCADLVAADVPKVIPDNTPGGVSSVINVGTGGTITDVNIKGLKGTHTYLGALIFTLQSPTGTTVTLINRSCDDDNLTVNFDLSLDDEAVQATLPCPYNTGTAYKPANALSAFDGENPMGNWTLNVSDNDAFDDTGSLTGWTLEICTGGAPCPPNLPVNGNPIASGTYQAGTQLTSSGSIGAGNNVTFRAGNNVEMQNNFNVPQTAVFQAQIGGCQ